MKTIKDETRINAPAGKVYEALTTQAGYRGWWNGVAEVPSAVGGEAQLHFVKDGTPINMRFRIDAMKPSESVRWTCIGNDMPSWVGTALNWNLKPNGAETLVSFEHDGWKDEAPAAAAQGWQQFLASLKAYAETGTGKPW